MTSGCIGIVWGLYRGLGRGSIWVICGITSGLYRGYIGDYIGVAEGSYRGLYNKDCRGGGERDRERERERERDKKKETKKKKETEKTRQGEKSEQHHKTEATGGYASTGIIGDTAAKTCEAQVQPAARDRTERALPPSTETQSNRRLQQASKSRSAGNRHRTAAAGRGEGRGGRAAQQSTSDHEPLLAPRCTGNWTRTAGWVTLLLCM